MMLGRFLVLLLLYAVPITGALAAYYECTDPVGKKTFSDRPCPGAEDRQTLKAEGGPVPGSSTGGKVAASGTGFLITPDGYLLTADHVVGNHNKLKVIFQDRTAYTAKKVFGDPNKDIALLKIEAQGRPVLPIAPPPGAQVTDEVIALGYPYATVLGAELATSMGHISAVRSTGDMDILQIDADINPGNSGGPILNRRGQVVGIVAAKLGSSVAGKNGPMPEGIGFGVPIQYAGNFLAQAAVSWVPGRAAELPPAEIFAQARNSVALIIASDGTPEDPASGAQSGSKGRYSIEDLAGSWVWTAVRGARTGSSDIVPMGDSRCIITGVVGATTLGRETVYELRDDRLVGLTPPDGYPGLIVVWTIQSSTKIVQTEGPTRGQTLTRVSR